MSEYVLVAAVFNLLTHGIFYLLVRVECYLGRPSVHTGHGALWGTGNMGGSFKLGRCKINNLNRRESSKGMNMRT